VADDAGLGWIVSGDPTTWDALVVGAGPAGAVAAALLADRGWRVLLVDKSAWPREKVCGGCLNAAAVQMLGDVGLAGALRQSQRLDRVTWHAGTRRLEIAATGGVAILRSDLDAALVAAAVSRGVTFLPNTAAKLLPASSGNNFRMISLGTETIRARVVLACDGISGTSLAAESWAGWRIHRNAWIGAATTCASEAIDMAFSPSAPSLGTAGEGRGGGLLSAQTYLRGNAAPTLTLPRSTEGGDQSAKSQNAAAPLAIPFGAIHMHIGHGGYVGAVRLDDGRIHIAAALNPTICRDLGGPPALIASILGGGDFSSQKFFGAGLLTRHRDHAGGDRVLAVGDALGYVEPFTGEGMAWAIEGAINAVAILPESAENWRSDLPLRWEDTIRRTIRAKQRWCRLMRPMMHHPLLAAAVLAAGKALPMAAQLVASAVCAAPPRMANASQRGAG
jgi:flavin-dependent dehydrogenase